MTKRVGDNSDALLACRLKSDLQKAESECSRLASRVEQEHRIGELIRTDKEAAENRVLELEWGLRNAVHELTSDYLQAGGDLAADTNPTLQYRNKLIERLEKLLAGAHAEEKSK